MHDVLSVGATDAFDRPASFSNRGASWVDLAAPGIELLTTAPTYANKLGPTQLGVDSGTSVSAPMVTGAAALLFARGLSNREVAARLFLTHARARRPVGPGATACSTSATRSPPGRRCAR